MNKEEKGEEKMANKDFLLASILAAGFLLCMLGLCFPWLVFNGLANFQDETFAVSGEVFAFGFGRNNYGAQVCVWSLAHGWNTAATDFWYGYLFVCGLALLLLAIFLAAAKKTRVSAGLALASSAIIMVTLMLALSYNPAVFVMFGSIPTTEGTCVGLARLYSDQATINTGLGFLFSFIGSLTVLLGVLLRSVKKN
jgi:hypothetical protein